MAQVCRFFQRGNCNYGRMCKYLHPGVVTQAGNGGGGTQTKLDSFSVPSVETIKVDLNEKPIWLLSSYAPGRDPPTQLIDGKDVSFEEMRLLAYQCQATGTPASYEQEWVRLNTQAQTQIQNILSNLYGAVDYIKQAQQSRADVFRYKTPTSSTSAGPIPAFSQSQQPQNANPFGTPITSNAFSAPSQSSSLGQPTLGQPSQPAPAFNNPSPFVAAGAAPGTQPAFGNPAFGQASMPQSAFNKTLQSAFGQPAFGQASALQPAFGKPSFGQPAFGQPGFAQPQLQQQPQQLQGVFGGNQPKPAFGQPTVLGSTTSQFAIAQNQNQNQAQPPPSPFTSYTQQLQSKPQGSNNGNTFAQQSNNGASPFGQANPFQQGQQNQQNQQVQQPQQGQAAPNPFLQTQKPAATPQPPQSTVINAFANPSSQQQQQQQQQQPTASAFNQGSTFQQQPQPPVTPNRTAVGHAQTPGRTDKKWDDPALEYSPQEIETFRASTFTMGMVPTVAPPKELCM